jgi:hypothetical protein
LDLNDIATSLPGIVDELKKQKIVDLYGRVFAVAGISQVGVLFSTSTRNRLVNSRLQCSKQDHTER